MEAIKKYLALSMLALTCIGGLYFSAAKSLSPVIPLDIELRELPMVDLTLRDPNITKNSISDQMELRSVVDKSQKLEKRLSQVKSTKQKKNVLKLLYKLNGSLYFYFDDVNKKRIDSSVDYKNLRSVVAKRKSLFKKYSKLYAQLENNKSLKAGALYQSISLEYNGANSGSSVSALKSIQKHLPKYLKRRVDFISAYHKARYGRGLKHASTLDKASRGLSRVHQIVANLTISQKYAGLNYVGKKVAKTKNSYKRYLTKALKKARTLSRDQRKRVLSFAMGIWRKSVGIKQTYASVPFSLAGYKDLKSVSAIKERLALEKLTKKEYGKSISIYKSLAKRNDGSVLGVRLDKRVVDLEYIKFKKTKSIESYEKSLIVMKNKYKDNSRFDNNALKNVQALKKSIVFKHKTLVNSLLLASSKKSTKKDIVRRSIVVAKRYARSQKEGSENERVMASVARIYQIHNDHRNAVSEYMKLVKKTKGTRSQGYLVRAISSQTVLAQWSKQPNWGRKMLGGRLDRNELADMYAMRLDHTKAWSDAAQLGLLLDNTGNRSKAFAVWKKQLKTNTKGVHAQRAAGTMLFTYNKIGRWQDLEKLSKLALKSKISPLYKDQMVSPSKMLAEGLYNGGRELFEGNQFKLASEKLKEFTNLFKTDKRRPESMYLLAKSFHKSSEFMAAVDTVFEISKLYKDTKYHKPALLMGGDWSVTMALENKALYFYESFVFSYKEDRKTIEVRDILSEIYLGRGLYGDAARSYLAQANDKRHSNEKRVNYAAKHLNIEKTYGDTDKAKASINIIDELAATGSDAEIAKKIYALELAVKNKNYIELAKHEKAFTQMDIMNTDSREALALARYTLARHKGEESFEDIFNLELKNPRKSLDKQVTHYKSIRKTYESICEIEPNSFCAPAMFELAKLTEKALYAIEDIKLPETLGDDTVNKFNNHKSKVILDLINEQSVAGIQADNRSRKGETTPDWSSAILWSVSDDWSYSQTREDSGFGYIQWKPVKVN